MGLISRRRDRMAQAVAAEVAKLTIADTSKAAPGTAGMLSNLPAGSTLTEGQAGLARLQARSVSAGATAVALPRDPADVTPFGPNAPSVPAPLDPVRPATGRAEPRRYQYPVGWNLPGQESAPVPWRLLRDFADKVDIARQCIRVRKNELTSLDWDITLSERAMASVMTSGAKAQDQLAAAQAIRDRFASEIERVRDFWEYPDRQNGLTFADWLGLLLEEHFVLDALSIYPRMTLGGDLHSLMILDGSTIKPLLDHQGNTPAPPQPAYQQILHGFPRGEFIATDGVADDDEYAADHLIYRPRYRRTTTPYGFSNTEEAIVTGTIYIARQSWVRNEFDEAVTPEALMKITGGTMQPEQWQDWSRIFNAQMAGQTTERMRWPVVPPGFDPVFPPQFAEKYTAVFDEHLIKLMCSCYDVMPSELGFVPAGGLGGKGHQEGEENTTYRRAIRPTTRWITSLCNEISWSLLGAPRELTMTFLGLESEDEEAAENILDQKVKGGRRTLNEARADEGRPLYDLDLANYPMMTTGRDIMFFTPDGPVIVSGTSPGLVDITQPSNPPPADPVEVATAVAQARNGGNQPPAPGDKPNPADKSRQLSADQPPSGRQRELNRFAAVASRRIARGEDWRDFEFFATDDTTAAELNRLGAAGDVDAIKAATADTTGGSP